MAGIDLNRTSSNVQLPAPVSAEIWGDTLNASAVMQLATRVELPGSGQKIQTITGEAVADWVDETEEKPVSRPTLGAKTMTPYTLAVIVPMSNQFRRDLPGLYRELVRRLPFALATKFDATVFHGSAPGSGFDVLSSATAVAINGNTYAGLVDAYQTISAQGGTLDGWAMSPQGMGTLLSETDTTGRPLFIPDANRTGAVGYILGAPIVPTKAAYLDTTTDILGIAGDWTSARFGTVEGVQISFSEGTITDGVTEYTTEGDDTVEIPNLINLWQRNMFAVRAEIEVGFVTRDADHFVRLTAGTHA